MVENRGNPRQRRLKEGRLVFNGRKSTASCLVRDESSDGARLKCGEPYLLPLQFELLIRGERAPKLARRIWVKGAEMGVSFIG